MTTQIPLPKTGRHKLVTNLTALIVGLIAGCVSGPLTGRPVRAAEGGAANHPAWSTELARTDASLDPNVPTPESILGHAVGDDAMRYDPMVRYLKALANASSLVTLTPYAMTHEGRTLYHLTITSEANHARLDEIKTDNAKLADPRKLADQEEADRILDTLPGIAWLAYAIHGDELSSTDAAVQVAYQLAAGTDEATVRLRDELVIFIDPLMNPDGRERYLSQLQPLRGKIPSTDNQALQHSGLWSAGRGNHYLFDMNRDWLMQTQPETRGRAAKIIEWHPHLVVDSHEMGSLDTYLFDPPREPINGNLAESVLNWRKRFAGQQAKALDAHGWSYYTQEWYEEWYPGYTNSWTSLLGAIGILYEQAGVNGASVKQEAGQVLTYRESVHHHLVSSLANIESLRADRKAILTDFLAERRWAVSELASGTEVFLVPPPRDEALAHRFTQLLQGHGIELDVAATGFNASDVTDRNGRQVHTRHLPAGTMIVRAAQPHRRLIHSLLDFDPHMTKRFLEEERRDLENHRGTRVYDITGWSLPMAYGLDAYWAGAVPELPPLVAPTTSVERLQSKGGYGYLLDGASGDLPVALVRLLEAGLKVRIAAEPFMVEGSEYPAGSALLRGHENPDDVQALLANMTDDLQVTVRPVNTALCQSGPDLGGRRFSLLTAPRVAIASQWPVGTTSFGAMWHLFDARMGLRVSPINLQSIAWMDLRRYNVIVLPGTWGSQALSAILDDGARKRLGSWVEAGGTLIAAGSSAAFLANKDRGLSAVRLRRDVLDELPVYEEARQREADARNVRIDPNDVWGSESEMLSPIVDDDDDEKPDKASPADTASLNRIDDWQQLFAPDGVIVAATRDPEHWLCFGTPGGAGPGDELPVLLSGAHALMARYPVATPVRLSADPDKLRLSGLLWPEARQRWAGSAYATVERVGYGQIILFTSDPIFRGYFEATGRLLLNAVILGPGLGTNQPVPW